VTAANISDKAGALEMAKNNSSSLAHVISFLCDGGYAGKPFSDRIKETTGANVEVVKRNELHQFQVLPKRWIVERSFGWLDKCRRLWKNCEQHLHTSNQMIVLAFIALLLKRF